MILVRDVFQAKDGKGDELVALFKEAHREWPQAFAKRIMTDARESFFTVVTETEVDSLSDWERLADQVFCHPGFETWLRQISGLVTSGRREFYTIEG